MWKSLLPALVPVLMAGMASIAPVWAESDAPQAAQSSSQTQQPDAFRVIPAGRLIGRTVEDVNGQQAGTVDSVLVDTGSDQVRNLVVGSGGFLTIGQELVAVPWQALSQIGQDGPLRVNVDKESLTNAPRITRDRIAELVNPAMITQITEYYAASGRQPREAPVQEQRQSQDRTGPPPHILVGRSYITTLIPPELATATDIIGDRVTTAAGTEIGHIDELMIDAQSGTVAYALVARGGFLGMGQEWVPVPFAPLAWNPSGQAYVLDTGISKLAELPGFPRQEDLPVTVSREELTELYQRYGAEPYWQ